MVAAGAKRGERRRRPANGAQQGAAVQLRPTRWPSGGKAPKGCLRLVDTQKEALGAAVESGPISVAHDVVRWRPVDLVQWVRDKFAMSISPQTLSRGLGAIGY